MRSNHVTHELRESHVEEEDGAILQAFIWTPWLVMASIHYSSLLRWQPCVITVLGRNH